MIVSDTHRFIFVHIPKNGGTSVRASLEQIRGAGATFLGRSEHPDLGSVDLSHLPMDTIASHFPGVFRRFATYRSFAIVRDPVARFASALGQWLRTERRTRILELPPDVLCQHAEAMLHRIAATPHTVEPALIHFRRQTDFIRAGDQQWVQTLLPFDDLTGARRQISACLCLDVPEIGHANAARVFRSPHLRRMVSAIEGPMRPLWSALPLGVKAGVVKTLLRAPPPGSDALMRANGEKPAAVLTQGGLAPLILRHYREDADLYRTLRSAPTQAAA